jgi:ketosteroid isomerase-like protein
MTLPSRIAAVEEIYGTLRTDTAAAVACARAAYHDDVVFRDPVQVTRGVDDFVRALESFAKSMDSIRFAMHDSFEDADRAFGTWTFHIAPKHGPRFSIHGASHLRFRDEKIVWHRDYWDLWGSFADSIPGVAGVYRSLIKRFA